MPSSRKNDGILEIRQCARLVRLLLLVITGCRCRRLPPAAEPIRLDRVLHRTPGEVATLLLQTGIVENVLGKGRGSRLHAFVMQHSMADIEAQLSDHLLGLLIVDELLHENVQRVLIVLLQDRATKELSELNLRLGLLHHVVDNPRGELRDVPLHVGVRHQTLK